MTEMTPLLFTNDRLRPEVAAKQGEDSYHLAIFQSERSAASTYLLEGIVDGTVVNSGREIQAEPDQLLVRLYQGLTPEAAGYFRKPELAEDFRKIAQLHNNSGDAFEMLNGKTVAKYLDQKLLGEDAAGITMQRVKDRNFLYGEAWKSTEELRQRQDRYEGQMSRALPGWCRMLNRF